jgi:ATP-dependent helicase/nuclease subunit A
VAVLFRRRTHIDEYVAAFEAEGLTVADGSTHLFECPSVRAVVAVVDWLRAPTDPERLRTLVTESALALDALQAPLEARDWRFSAITTGPALPDREAAIVTRLQGLRDQRGIQAAQPPQTLVEEVVSHLALEQDPHDLLPDTTRTERQRTLDALREWLAEWPAGDDTTPAEFASLVAPFVETPRKGPRQTRIGTADADVICTVIHKLKGDEADVVALADLGPELWQPGVPHQRLLTRGSTVALAPPELNIDHTDRLPIFEGGLYTPPGAGDSARSEGGLPRDVGLRWATERWQDASSDAPTRLIGHDHLQTVAAATRAEAWRVLYVALTRARDHLVVPLPRDLPGGVAPRDRWLETLRRGLQFDGTPGSGTYTCEPSTRAPGDRFVVGVNDVRPHTGATGQSEQTTSQAVPVATDAAVTPRYDPTEPSTPAPFVPRMLQPSTLAPLATAPDRYRLAYLQGASLHTAAEAIALDAPIAECGLGPAEIGTHVHDFLTTALARLEEMPTDDDTLETVLERALTEAGQAHWQAVTPAQRQALQQFVFDRLQPQLREAACWQRLLAADHVYTEQPVPGVVRLDGLAFEFDGTADVVCQCADDHWEVIELKIALAPLTDETRARYRMQAATYAYFLARQVDGTVGARVEVFGAERATIDAATAPPVTETLRQLVPDTTDSRGE